MTKMIDIVVNEQLVAVVAEDLVKLFVNTLVSKLPVEMSIATYEHIEPQNLQEQNDNQLLSE